METISNLTAWLASNSGLFEAVSLLALANLDIVARRTALRGNSHYLDALAILPGMHLQMLAPDLSKGEYPACAAMTTGYVFRVENSATVSYLQGVGRTGQVTIVKITDQSGPGSIWADIARALFDFRGATFASAILYLTAVCSSLGCLSISAMESDYYAVVAMLLMVLARAMFTFVIRHRAKPGWFGAPEPGIQSDLLVLLSQDRWVRIQGAANDVKAVTSGTWLREPTKVESSLEGLAKFLIFAGVAIFMNARHKSKFWFFATLSLSTVCAHASNECLDSSMMHGRKLEVSGSRIKYNRRLELSKELVAEFKRIDCFVGMGMIPPQQAEAILNEVRDRPGEKDPEGKSVASYDGAVVM